jgi:phage I-like protein
MAEISGRKKGGLPPQSMKTTSEDNHLSAEERYVAKMMGMNEADYLKWKS